MPSIFLSYSRVDLAFVETLYDRLQRMRPNDHIWYDKAPDGLLGGDSWWDQILDAIADADIFIYVLSNESVQSEYCKAEFEEARRLQKRIITIQARDRTQLTGALGDIQYVDMKNGVDDPDALVGLSGALDRQTSQVKKRRAKWRSRTPKPSEEKPITRDHSAPEVDTPTLQIPHVDQQKPDTNIRVAYIGGGFLILSVIIAGLFGLWQGVFATNPSATPTPTEMTETVDNTPNIADAAQTLVAGQTAQKIVDDATATADQKTLEAQQTVAQQANGTATATVWTKTPTPDLTASVAALLAEWAEGTLTQQAIDSEELAKIPVVSNDEWTPYEQEFDGVTMVLVPVGSFMMGSDNGDSNEQPVHKQDITAPFWVDKYEVTQGDFERLGGIKERDNGFDGDNRPVENITWFEARDFCESRGGRLLTEKEWEYVARGSDNLVYPWGDDWNRNYAVWAGNSSNQTAEVGSRSPESVSWVGAYDMSGNVWEWVSSLYTNNYPYSYEDEVDYTNNRSLRGGSWYDLNTAYLRASYRRFRDPDNSFDNYGFRCARDG